MEMGCSGLASFRVGDLDSPGWAGEPITTTPQFYVLGSTRLRHDCRASDIPSIH